MIVLKREIENRKISQARLANLSGTNQTSLCNAINGRITPWPKMVTDVSKAMRLLGWEGTPEQLWTEADDDGE